MMLAYQHYYSDLAFSYLMPDPLASPAYPTIFTPSSGASLYGRIVKEKLLDIDHKAATIQTCFRIKDGVEKGGDGVHLSLYRLAIAHSLNAETRKLSMQKWLYFLIEKLELDRKRLHVTFCNGGQFLGTEIPADDEAIDFWKSEKIQTEKITSGPWEDNFQNTKFEPFCGPTTELFYERDDKLVEIGIHINFAYLKSKIENEISIVAHNRNVFSCGFGIERLEYVLNDYQMIQECEDINPLIEYIAGKCKVHSMQSEQKKHIAKLADQIRGLTLISSEGAMLGHRGRQDVFRKHVLDTLLQAKLLGLYSKIFMEELIDLSIRLCENRFPGTVIVRQKVLSTLEQSQHYFGEKMS